MIVNKAKLRRLLRQVISNSKVDDLTLLIKSGDYKQSDRVGTLPDSFERRKKPLDGEFIVGVPEKRIINPISRSPHDIWTIIHQNKIVVQGQFIEIRPVLEMQFQNMVAYPNMVAKQVLMYGGMAAIMALCFFVGLWTGRSAFSKVESVQYTHNLSSLEKTVFDVMEQQKNVGAALTSISGQLEMARKEAALEAKKKASAPKVSASRPVEKPMTFAEKLEEQTKDRELRRILDMEDQKTKLFLQDRELDDQGFTEFHKDRHAIKVKIESLDKEINEIKKKYNIPID